MIFLTGAMTACAAIVALVEPVASFFSGFGPAVEKAFEYCGCLAMMGPIMSLLKALRVSMWARFQRIFFTRSKKAMKAELEREHEEARREKEAAGAAETGSSDTRSDAGIQRGSEVGFDGPVESQAAHRCMAVDDLAVASSEDGDTSGRLSRDSTAVGLPLLSSHSPKPPPRGYLVPPPRSRVDASLRPLSQSESVVCQGIGVTNGSTKEGEHASHRVNKLGHAVKLGGTFKVWYCGRKKRLPGLCSCGGCDDMCGLRDGCPCADCEELQSADPPQSDIPCASHDDVKDDRVYGSFDGVSRQVISLGEFDAARAPPDVKGLSVG